MAADVVLRGGTVVDGTGAPPRTADVAIEGDRVVAVGRYEGPAVEDLDCDGALVTPGFVDIHTHLDAQLLWDPLATSSCWHGVTSVVLGSCGVTFAPCRPDDREYLAELMESVEDIPRDTIMAGLAWDWESYGEYLDALGRARLGVNAGGMVGHCAIRYQVMGDRSLDPEPATADDIAAIVALVDDAVSAGALGFSTSRTFLHRVPDGRPVPGTYARPDELYAIADVLGRHGRGILEVAPQLEAGPAGEVAWMAEAARRSGRPVSFGLTQVDMVPDLHRDTLALVDEAVGADPTIGLHPQTTARSIGLTFGLGGRTPFDRADEWRALRDRPRAENLAAVRDPDRRARLLAAGEAKPPPDPYQLFVLDPDDPRYDTGREASLGALADGAGESPAATFLRLLDDTDGRVVLRLPILNQDLEQVGEMLGHPQVTLGLADAGAHVGQIIDASLPTFFLSYWVRERERFSIEEAIHMLAGEPAALFGATGRGVLREGAAADVNVIDFDRLAVTQPEWRNDLPAGAGRWVQGATGYVGTWVNGMRTMAGGEPTGALPGRVLRG